MKVRYGCESVREMERESVVCVVPGSVGHDALVKLRGRSSRSMRRSSAGAAGVARPTQARC